MSDRFEGKGEKSMAYLDCSVKSCTYIMKTAVAAKATFRWRDAKQPKHRAPVAEVSKTAEQTVQPVTH